jgi:hypothetical protein
MVNSQEFSPTLNLILSKSLVMLSLTAAVTLFCQTTNNRDY